MLHAVMQLLDTLQQLSSAQHEQQQPAAAVGLPVLGSSPQAMLLKQLIHLQKVGLQ
jgi:hypothetical protein